MDFIIKPYQRKKSRKTVSLIFSTYSMVYLKFYLNLREVT